MSDTSCRSLSVGVGVTFCADEGSKQAGEVSGASLLGLVPMFIQVIMVDSGRIVNQTLPARVVWLEPSGTVAELVAAAFSSLSTSFQ